MSDYHVACREAESHRPNALPPDHAVDERFQQKLADFKAAMAMRFAYYNFCKVHGAVRCTPAMEAGEESSQWTVAELICGRQEKPG